MAQRRRALPMGGVAGMGVQALAPRWQSWVTGWPRLPPGWPHSGPFSGIAWSAPSGDGGQLTDRLCFQSRKSKPFPAKPGRSVKGMVSLQPAGHRHPQRDRLPGLPGPSRCQTPGHCFRPGDDPGNTPRQPQLLSWSPVQRPSSSFSPGCSDSPVTSW